MPVLKKPKGFKKKTSKPSIYPTSNLSLHKLNLEQRKRIEERLKQMFLEKQKKEALKTSKETTNKPIDRKNKQKEITPKIKITQSSSRQSLNKRESSLKKQKTVNLSPKEVKLKPLEVVSKEKQENPSFTQIKKRPVPKLSITYKPSQTIFKLKHLSIKRINA